MEPSRTRKHSRKKPRSETHEVNRNTAIHRLLADDLPLQEIQHRGEQEHPNASYDGIIQTCLTFRPKPCKCPVACRFSDQKFLSALSFAHLELSLHNASMAKLIPALFAILLGSSSMAAQVLHFDDLNTRDFAHLDLAKTVVIIPGGILEEHGPYLPAGTDGIFNRRFADDLAKIIASRPGWTVLMLPLMPLGAGAANEIGYKYFFAGSCTVLPATLRSVYLDIADQLGAQHFRWILIVSGHGDPAHNRMLDQAGDYFHDTYGGEMVNVFGYLWAMDADDLRTPREQREDGLAEHATMVETSWILALDNAAVSKDYKSAKPLPGENLDQLQKIASSSDWPGYFGAPALAYSALGKKQYARWLQQGEELVSSILAGKAYRNRSRLGDVDDPADAAALANNERLERQHQAWLAKKKGLLK